MFEEIQKNVESIIARMAVDTTIKKVVDSYPPSLKFDWSTGSFLTGVALVTSLLLGSKLWSGDSEKERLDETQK